MSTKDRIYFVHIPKTGGVSVEHILNQVIDSTVCPAYSWQELYSMDSIDEYGLFYGHLHYFCKALIGDAFRFTVLRDPVERLMSAFQHVKRSKDHPIHPLALEYDDIGAALNSPRLRRHFSNIMTRFLGLRPQFNKFDLPKLAFNHSIKNLDPGEILINAKEAILEMDFIGFTETLNVDQYKLANILTAGKSLDIEVEERNQNPDRKTVTYREILTEDTIQQLEGVLDLDYEIYNFALSVARERGWRNEL